MRTQSLLAGTGSLSRQMDRVDALPFRQAVVAGLRLVEPLQAKPQITIFNKKVYDC